MKEDQQDIDQQNYIETQDMNVEDEALSDTPTIKSPSLEDSQTDEERVIGKTFVSRVSSIPIVQDGLSTVQTIASKTSLGRFALSTANSITKYTINGSHQPKYIQSYYESYIQPHVDKADAFGCRSLDLIQNKFPVVNQPTSEIVRAVTAPSSQIVDGMKVKLDHSFKQPANQVVKEANKRFGNVVDNVEAAFERYFPAPKDEQKPSVTGEEMEKKKEKEEEDSQEINSAIRIISLLSHASVRLSRHVSDQVKNSASYIPLTRDDLARITETSALLQKTTANIQLLQEALVQSVTLYAQAAQKRLPVSVTDRLQTLQTTTQERLQALTQQVSIQLQQVIDYFKLQSNETPDWLKTRVSSLVQATNKHIEVIRSEFGREDISSLEKTKNVAQALQNQVLPLLQQFQSQLNHYSEMVRQKASNDFKLPLEYLGLVHAPKLASA
ncbi:MAG: hypothetical protein EXX96DRAFT_572171 [Benjaminiella poitrasii]|nr:MAG: hypothetical protein EXX96DRAFT_572171 [Benjaminiella poitrasii]